MNQSGLKERGFENRRTFSNLITLSKNLLLSAFPIHGQLNKRSKQFEDQQR